MHTRPRLERGETQVNIENILVSVIVPTYKRPVSYLSRAVKSLLNQTHRDIEIVVIDDSTNAYPDRPQIETYVRNVALEHSNIIYIQNEKSLGGALARNRGIQACHGEYITFLDDDDEYRPEKVERQLRFMLCNGCDMSFSDMIMYDTAGHVVDFREHRDISSFDNDSLLRYHLTRKITGTPTFMYRADKLREIGGFDDAILGQEFYLMLKTIKKGLKIQYMSGCDVVVYKHQDGGISQGKNKIVGENLVFETIKEHFDHLSCREQKFATFRHWAVLIVAYKRNKMYLSILGALIVAFFSSPRDFISESNKFLSNIRRNK